MWKHFVNITIKQQEHAAYMRQDRMAAGDIQS
jgi:hypothetical protein